MTEWNIVRGSGDCRVLAVQQKWFRSMRFRTLPVALLAFIPQLSAAEFSIQIVDGLNRPIAGVRVDVSCASTKQKTKTLLFESDENGMIHGEYNSASCKPQWTDVGKHGYQSYSSGFRSRYVLHWKFDAQEVLRVVNLKGDDRLRGLRELLAGEVPAPGESNFTNFVFYHEAQLRSPLRTLASDPLVTERVRNLLSLIAVPDDLHLIMQLPPPPATPGFPERWRYMVATALVGPDDEEEWSFLRRCALNDFDDRWVDNGAIQTLRLTGSPRSQSILEEAQVKNPKRARPIADALDYIKSNPAPLADANIEALAKRVAELIKIGDWQGNGEPRFNEAGDKALVNFTFHTSMDLLVYTATFHRIDGVWTLRGAHETYQAFAPAPSVRRKR
jgi:hypothetical protein